eukprot:evm.model.NODE_235_length_25475_cov_36.991245.11
MADDAIPSPSPAPAAPPSATTDKATTVVSSSSSWEDQEASIPDISAVLAKLSLTENEVSKEQEQDDDRDKRSKIRAAARASPPPVSTLAQRAGKARIRQQQPEPPGRAPATPVQRRKPPSQQHSQATPSPTLSRYGADLGDIRGTLKPV